MRILAAVAPIALALASTGAAAQTLFKCTAADGRVTYQETPCVGERSQKRLDAPKPTDREEVQARRLLEREAVRGSELAGRFAQDARERELARMREREAFEREERLKRKLEEESRPIEDIPWDRPWGFPGKPGQARPQPKPKS